MTDSEVYHKHFKSCACTCGHIMYQHYENADEEERAESPDMPEHGCAMDHPRRCECKRFWCTTAEWRLYILVRRNLPKSVQAVQACHAAIELMHRDLTDIEYQWGEFGPTISMLGVKGVAELEFWSDFLGEAGVVFCEPDLGHEPTALAYFGPYQKGFEALRLL